MNEEFTKRIIAMRGDIGKKWLNNLPQIINHYKEKWNITVFPPFKLSYNYVAPAKTLDNKQVALKISFPNNHEFEAEAEAIRFFNGNAAINILKEDKENAVILLEKAEPGESVRTIIPEEERISIVTEVMKKLHKPVSQNSDFTFPTILEWAKAFDRYKGKFSDSGPVPQKLFDRAEEIFKEYPKEKKPQVLLHGDLHADNILSSKRGWLVIDPKGIIGEAEFEVGGYLYNPYYDYAKGSDYKKLQTARILQFSEELGFDKERILDWAFAYAIISVLWFLEDEGEFKPMYLQNAELISKLKSI